MRALAPVLLLGVLLSVGCTGLSRTERERLSEIKAAGLPVPNEEVKSPAAAGLLNLLPGFGNFYLAIGTDESEHYLYGLVNLVSWPYSIVWGVPEAWIDAGNINKRETVYFFTYGPGVPELERRLRAQGSVKGRFP